METILNMKGLKNIFRKNIFLSRLYTKLHSLKTKRIINQTIGELKRLDSYPIQKVNNIQNEKLLAILKYANTNTVYYNTLFDENRISTNSIVDFKKIPFLTKQKIRNHIGSMISRQYEIENLGKKNTGGSTGEPLEFYCNTEAGLIDYGHHWYLYELMGYKKGDTIIGCGGVSIPKEVRHNNVYWIERNKGNVFGDYLFSVLYLTEDNIDLYIKKIITLKPSILRGYPSFYDSLAHYILKNNIKLDFKIKGVNLTAEMCSQQQRINIEKAFSTMVYFEYGHSEVALYSYTKDDSYIYQSSPTYGYIEVLNEDGSDTQVGEVGNIIVTGFLNKGMPFIRYQTGDLGELHQRNGGVVQFKTIYGRSQDFIISKKKQKVYLTALIFGQHLKAFSNMEKWQITQNEIGVITISIVKSNNYSIRDEQDIINKISSVTDVDINFEYVNSIPQTSTGKHLFLVQNLKD